MAKYSKGAGKSVARAMRKKKSRSLKSGSGRKVVELAHGRPHNTNNKGTKTI